MKHTVQKVVSAGGPLIVMITDGEHTCHWCVCVCGEATVRIVKSMTHIVMKGRKL